MRTRIGLELCLDGGLRLGLGVAVLPLVVVPDDGDVLLPEQVGSDPRLLRRNTATATVRCTILSLLACPAGAAHPQLPGRRAGWTATARGQYHYDWSLSLCALCVRCRAGAGREGGVY